jgi:hypothetical protein
VAHFSNPFSEHPFSERSPYTGPGPPHKCHLERDHHISNLTVGTASCPNFSPIIPSANAALEGLKPGLERAIREAGSVSKRVIAGTLRDGELVERREASDIGLTTIRWQSVQNVLARLVPGERVHCGHRLSGYKGVEVRLYGGCS